MSLVPIGDVDVDLLILPVAEDDVATRLEDLASQLDEVIRRARDEFRGSPDDAACMYGRSGKAKRLALVGLGPSERVDAERLRQAAAVGQGFAAPCRAVSVGIVSPVGIDLDPAGVVQALVEGFMLSGYRFTRYKTSEEPYAGVERLVVWVDEAADGEPMALRWGVERGRIVAEATCTARDLVNTSPHEKTPTMFSEVVEQAGRHHGFSVEVWDKSRIEEEGMGGLLAVNRGSQEPPTFTIMTWKPEEVANDRPIVLVGKGVMFDTGGLSLKPTKDSMDGMKADMAGAAAVVGTMEAVARLGLPLHVVGLVPATDNRPGENAYVPGDVIRMHSGKTVEVLNTDAEGRMILADALSWASTLDPALVIESSTLTGAQVIALGSQVAAVMTNDRPGGEERLHAMEEAGRRSGDRVHRMPMYEHYGKQIESDVADIRNVGGREAGSITAAKFLEHFTSYPWVHVDLAGPAFLKDARPCHPKGGTGFGVRLLVEFLRPWAGDRVADLG